MGAVSGNVPQSPHGLLSHVRLMAAEEFDEDRYGASIDDDLGLLSRSRRNVGQGPCCLELDECMGRSKEFHKTADNASLDDFLDRRISLFR